MGNVRGFEPWERSVLRLTPAPKLDERASGPSGFFECDRPLKSDGDRFIAVDHIVVELVEEKDDVFRSDMFLRTSASLLTRS
mgnify:CR=1 FL=1